MPAMSWIRAGFALPLIPAYYRAVAHTLVAVLMSRASLPIKRFFPEAYVALRSIKGKLRGPA
jgi:hypothetical protein